ncbi:hypothetical protein HMPREF0908_0994 [Selenomonas flueggei ATCC 43531]|uniref:Uncharacterized protein n=1 Tax=Selenomonas flueggei ATCC 43531 TaxID=638302 RepID=C4V3A0_9FIRM|nr:hypothetical protein HMPREF0908_0994 [Selenomonas flueggei ATCC 43531]
MSSVDSLDVSATSSEAYAMEEYRQVSIVTAAAAYPVWRSLP